MPAKFTPFTFNLIRPARSKGGDLYQSDLGNDVLWKVYFPQQLSRPKGSPKKQIQITVKISE